jgi:TonB family protein
MLRAGALLLLAALVAGPLAAQSVEPETAPAPAPGPTAAPAPAPVRTAPMPPIRHPQRVEFGRVKTVDIPQWAKDEGHNGTATWTATVAADGTLIALVLKESSMSPAIDAAAQARARTLTYSPATDREGNRIEASVDVAMEYGRHDDDSPGGGLGDYTCGDLIRELDWFTAANAGRRKLFWPQNAFTSLATIIRLEQGLPPDPAAIVPARKAREKLWTKLVKTCRKAPGRLMLTEVDQPDAYARLVNSF